MTKLKYAVLLLLSMYFAACSLTLPVEGRMQNSNERFLGETTGYLSGKGELTVTLMSGSECLGAFQYAKSGKSGKGTLTCNDGRSGTFIFTSNGTRGNGFGKTTNGEMFTFRFGDPDYIGIKEVEWREVEKIYNKGNQQ